MHCSGTPLTPIMLAYASACWNMLERGKGWWHLLHVGGLRSLRMSWEWLGNAWKADFGAICVACALFACLGCGLEGRFCCYLSSWRSLCLSWVAD